jgi:O-antigen/teichoic acid export membrane protein
VTIVGQSRVTTEATMLTESVTHPTPAVSVKDLSLRTRLRAAFPAKALVYVVGGSLTRGMQIAILPIYARYLTPTDFGLSGFAIAVAGLIEGSLGFGVAAGISRYYFDYCSDSQRLRNYLMSSFVFLALAAGVCIAILDVGGATGWLWFATSVPFTPYGRLMIWGTYASLLAGVPLVLYQAEQRAHKYLAGQIGISVGTVVATLLFIGPFKMGAQGQLLGRLCGTATAAALLVFFFVRRMRSWSWRWDYVKLSVRYGMPLIPHTLGLWAVTYFARVILERSVTIEELGLYTIATQLSFAMSIVIVGFNSAWGPRYFELMKMVDDETRRVHALRVVGGVTSIYVAVVGWMCLAMILLSPEMVRLLLPPKFTPATQYLPALLLTQLFSGYYNFATLPLFFDKRTWTIPAITAASAIGSVLLTALWSRLWGAQGAAWATASSMALMFAIAWNASKRRERGELLMRRYASVTVLIMCGAALMSLPQTRHLLDQEIVTKAAVLALVALGAGRTLITPALKRMSAA